MHLCGVPLGVTLFRGREDFKFVKRQQFDDEFDD